MIEFTQDAGRVLINENTALLEIFDKGHWVPLRAYAIPVTQGMLDGANGLATIVRLYEATHPGDDTLRGLLRDGRRNSGADTRRVEGAPEWQKEKVLPTEEGMGL